jgi:hypothetical protein
MDEPNRLTHAHSTAPVVIRSGCLALHRGCQSLEDAEGMKEVRRLFLPASEAGRIRAAALEHALDQVAELLGGELISFEIGRQLSLTIDDQRV